MHEVEAYKMKQCVRVFAIVVLAAGAGACAGPQTPVAHHAAPNYEWVAGNRAAEVKFRQNNQSCSKQSASIAGYESCMSSLGYQLSGN